MENTATKYVRRPFPSHTLEGALRVAQAIQDQNNGKPMNRVLLANAIQKKPASSDFKALLSSSLKYGLTAGTEKSELISLERLGDSATRPRDVVERSSSLRKAALQPELLLKIYQHYNNGKLPQGDFFLNVLERDFSVPRDRCQECADLVLNNGKFVGFIRDVQGSPYVILDGETRASDEGSEEEEEAEVEAHASRNGAGQPVALIPPSAAEPPARERFIFVAHGKNKKPLEQLEKVLKSFGIPYKVAVDEPQMARPISTKVAETMRQCHSAILIFTADEELQTATGETVHRPSENVVHELGAASILYENRIVIFKEEGLNLATNFADIGYIPFEKDRLDAKGAELIKELIALRLVKVQAA